MALNKRTLKGLIELSDLRNEDGALTEDDVVGVSTDKQMISTKADLDGVNLKNYKLLPPGYYAFVADTSRRGDKMALAYNNTDRTYIVSTWYVVFNISESGRKVLLPDYLYMYYNRGEFDRYARFNSWGSAREYFWFEDMESVEMEIPPLPIQQKYVDIYNALQENQRCYERGLDDLKLVIDGTIDQFKHTAPRMPLGKLLREVDVRNSDGIIDTVYGVTMNKQFIPSVANLDGVDIKKYKQVYTNQMACNFMHVGRDESLPIAINGTESPILVSPAYFVFETKSDACLAEFIVMWLSRDESGRYCWFISDTSVRGGFSLDQFYTIEIPIPDSSQQHSLVDIYKVYITRKEINECLKAQLKDICPILIKGSLEEATA